MAATRTTAIPETVLLSAQTLDDLEDWLAANDPAFLQRMRRIRNDEDVAGQGKDLEGILERWPVSIT
ncbi:MAG: MoaD/ThiS family protein [Planctomycetes bacterium]|nr:MoaD/ThiS family protein [Planctomycetota bacterium]